MTDKRWARPGTDISTSGAGPAGPVVHVFAGPTISAKDVIEVVPGALVHPPVAHGDLLSLDTRAGDVVVIIDGYYHQRAPVRHKEVLHLLDHGVQVIGCASMGALRAAELAAVGMVGYGRVYQMYANGEIDADDEVAIAHQRGNSFLARNVPLVNVRFAAAAAVSAEVATPAQGQAIVATARTLHYTDRSWRAVYAALTAAGQPDLVAAFSTFLTQHPEAADLKRRDAWQTLTDLPEILSTATLPVLDHWRNRHLYSWLPEFAGRSWVDRPDPQDQEPDQATDEQGGSSRLVSDADILRHEQIYDPDFPARWRDFVVGEVSRAPGIRSHPDRPTDVAREVLAGAGAAKAMLSSSNPFLTRRERADLQPDEAMLRTLVRCYAPPRGLYDVLARLPRPAAADEIQLSIRQARALNDQVLWRNRIRLVERLSPDRLQRHLEGLWRVPTGDEELLLAAAQDRGLPTIAEAIATVRPYFLRDNAMTGGSMAEKWGVM